MTKNRSNYELIIKLLFKHSPPANTAMPELGEDEFNNLINLIFLNNHTFQLSRKGLSIFSKVFEEYRIDLPEHYSLRSKDLITLDRECRLPYYISVSTQGPPRTQTKPHIILFERELAILLKLYDGDLDMVRDMPRDGNF